MRRWIVLAAVACSGACAVLVGSWLLGIAQARATTVVADGAVCQDDVLLVTIREWTELFEGRRGELLLGTPRSQALQFGPSRCHAYAVVADITYSPDWDLDAGERACLLITRGSVARLVRRLSSSYVTLAEWNAGRWERSTATLNEGEVHWPGSTRARPIGPGCWTVAPSQVLTGRGSTPADLVGSCAGVGSLVLEPSVSGRTDLSIRLSANGERRQLGSFALDMVLIDRMEFERLRAAGATERGGSLLRQRTQGGTRTRIQ